jgi:disulfide bond formation protein DsbB
MWRYVKIPKAIALLAFLLPWMTVSCSGTKLVSASGFGLAFGRFTSEIPQSDGQVPTDHHEMNVLLIAAIAVIVIGLALSLVRGRQALLGVLVSAVVGFGLILGGTWRYSKTAMLEEMKKQGATGAGDNPLSGNPFGGHSNNPFGGDPAQAAAAMIRIDWHFGYWLALGALVVAAVMAWLAYSGRESSFASGVRDALANGGASGDDAPRANVTCPSCGRSYPAGTHFCPQDGTALN